MINFLKNIFGGGEKVNLQEIIAKGALIIDVRTAKEFQSGHLKNSKNIPLDKLPESLSLLDKNKPVIVCCASGARSASARRFMITNGFAEVYNGGSWANLQ